MISRHERANLLQSFMPGNVFVFQDTKEIIAPEMRPKSFGSIEKRVRQAISCFRTMPSMPFVAPEQKPCFHVIVALDSVEYSIYLKGLNFA